MINETWQLAPWADVLYACDLRWWKLRGPSPDAFGGLRVQGHIGNREGLFPGTVHGGVKTGVSHMIFDGPHIGAGANSGFQALNFVARTGARRVILLGYDFGFPEAKAHWHADHGAGMSNPTNRFLATCAQILDRQAGALKMQGVEVINATRSTRLTRYRQATIDEALGGA